MLDLCFFRRKSAVSHSNSQLIHNVFKLWFVGVKPSLFEAAALCCNFPITHFVRPWNTQFASAERHVFVTDANTYEIKV